MDKGEWNTEALNDMETTETSENFYTATAVKDAIQNINRVLKKWNVDGFKKRYIEDLHSMCLGYLTRQLRTQKGWQQVRTMIHHGTPIFKFDMERRCVTKLTFSHRYESLNAICNALDYDVLNYQAEKDIDAKATEVSEISFASIEKIKF